MKHGTHKSVGKERTSWKRRETTQHQEYVTLVNDRADELAKLGAREDSSPYAEISVKDAQETRQHIHGFKICCQIS